MRPTRGRIAHIGFSSRARARDRDSLGHSGLAHTNARMKVRDGVGQMIGRRHFLLVPISYQHVLVRETTMEKWESEMRRLEEAVRVSDGQNIRARWESGRYMLTLRDGKKQLPPGMLDELARTVGVVRSELGARMRFAEKYSTEEELSTAVETFRTWTDIRQRGLTDTPRVEEQEQETDDDTDAEDEQGG
jgi:hypothetical protein